MKRGSRTDCPISCFSPMVSKSSEHHDPLILWARGEEDPGRRGRGDHGTGTTNAKALSRRRSTTIFERLFSVDVESLYFFLPMFFFSVYASLPRLILLGVSRHVRIGYYYLRAVLAC